MRADFNNKKSEQFIEMFNKLSDDWTGEKRNVVIFKVWYKNVFCMFYARNERLRIYKPIKTVEYCPVENFEARVMKIQEEYELLQREKAEKNEHFKHLLKP